MTWLIQLFLGNRIVRLIGAALVAVAGVLTFGVVKKREGRVEARSEAKEEDLEHAQDIRDRVSTDRAGRVQSVKDRGYRD